MVTAASHSGAILSHTFSLTPIAQNVYDGATVSGGDGWERQAWKSEKQLRQTITGAGLFLLEGLSNYLPSATQGMREESRCVVCGMRGESLNRSMYLNLDMKAT
jgi:hypothetical protein